MPLTSVIKPFYSETAETITGTSSFHGKSVANTISKPHRFCFIISVAIKHPDQSSLGEEMAYSAYNSTLQSIIFCKLRQEHKQLCCVHIRSQEQRKNKLMLAGWLAGLGPRWLSVLLSSPGPVYEMVQFTFGRVFPPQLTIKTTTPDTSIG